LTRSSISRRNKVDDFLLPRQGRKGEYKKIFEEVVKEGFLRVRVDGKMFDLREEIKNLESIRLTH
jgi:excinuclease ABC subunit A